MQRAIALALLVIIIAPIQPAAGAEPFNWVVARFALPEGTETFEARLSAWGTHASPERTIGAGYSTDSSGRIFLSGSSQWTAPQASGVQVFMGPLLGGAPPGSGTGGSFGNGLTLQCNSCGVTGGIIQLLVFSPVGVIDRWSAELQVGSVTYLPVSLTAGSGATVVRLSESTIGVGATSPAGGRAVFASLTSVDIDVPSLGAINKFNCSPGALYALGVGSVCATGWVGRRADGEPPAGLSGVHPWVSSEIRGSGPFTFAYVGHAASDVIAAYAPVGAQIAESWGLTPVSEDIAGFVVDGLPVNTTETADPGTPGYATQRCDTWSPQVAAGQRVDTRAGALWCEVPIPHCRDSCASRYTIRVEGMGTVEGRFLSLPSPVGAEQNLARSARDDVGCVGIGSCNYTLTLTEAERWGPGTCYAGPATFASNVTLTCTSELLSGESYNLVANHECTAESVGGPAVAGATWQGGQIVGVLYCEPEPIVCPAPAGKSCWIGIDVSIAGQGRVEINAYDPDDRSTTGLRIGGCSGLNQCSASVAWLDAPSGGVKRLGCQAGPQTVGTASIRCTQRILEIH